MYIPFLVVHVLTCLVSATFLPVTGRNPFGHPYDGYCRAPPPYEVTLEELVALQPLYYNFLPAIPLFADVDNVCFTYDPLPDGTYLLILSTVFSNGKKATESYIESGAGAGVLLAGSSTCNAKFIIFDYFETEDCALYLGYACFNYGDCSLAPGNNIPVSGFSTSNSPISLECLDTAIDRMARFGVPRQEYFILPFQKDDACYTYFPC